MEPRVSIPPEFLVGGAAAFGASLYAIKRLATLAVSTGRCTIVV